MIHMKLQLPYLVNVPPFMLKGLENKKISFLHKIYLIIKGKFVSLIISRINGKLFCLLLNLLFKNDGNLYFDGKYYFKKLNEDKKIYYPNKRIQRVLINHVLHFERLLDSYNLGLVKFEDNDLVIDCGANVGELNLALKSKNIYVNYYGFEPDVLAYECCKLNNEESKENIKNIGLSDKSGESKFYEDSFGGNSSLISFGENEETSITVEKLDNLKIDQNIKLLKIDAEGYEPEVLKGSKETLKNIEFISVDFGPERGVNQEDTIIEVNDYLIENNFSLIKFEVNRITGLYKNMSNGS